MNTMFKKVMAMGLAALLGVGTMNMMAVSATETETETTPVYNVELLENGGFETLDDAGFPAGWTATVDSDATGASTLETTTVASGNHAMKLVANNVSAEDPEAPDVKKSTRIYTRFNYTKYPHSTTVITGRIRIDNLVGDSYVQIECASPALGPTNFMEAEILYKEKTDGWISFETSVREVLNKEADPTAIFFIRLFGIGTVYVDDISIKDKEGQLLPSIMEHMGYKQQMGSPNVTHGYLSNENYAGEVITPYSGDDCYYVWTTEAVTDVRSYYTFPARNRPEGGVNYRMSLRFKPKTGTTNSGPRFDIMDSSTNISAAQILARFNPDCWTVGNVTTDGWRELSAYFTMPETDATYVYLMMRGVYGGWIDDLMLERDYDEGAKILNENFESISSAKVGDKIKVKVHAVSEKTEAEGGKPVTILLAQYNRISGKLQCVDMKIAEKTVNSGTEVAVTSDSNRKRVQSAEDFVLDYTIPESAADCTIKAFFWDKASGLKPLGEVDSITVNAASAS